MSRKQGFTVVELAVVIFVIAILATITIVGYRWMREDAMDTKIRATAKAAGDALSLRESQAGSRISGQGVFNATNGMDTLVSQYLPQGYRDGLTSKNATNTNQILRWYPCNDGGGGFVIYASLNNPTSEDTTRFNNIRSACGQSTTTVPITGNPRYNYAQVF